MHDHKHTHEFSWKHMREHPICIATIVYNILVLAVELVIIATVNDLSLHDLIGYEGILQGIHLIGIVLLGVINWYWIHRWSNHHESSLQSTGKFFSISTIMFVAHIVLLHLLPRWIGFELHVHEGEHGHSEMIEYAALAIIIVFVTIAFWQRENILSALGLKNKYVVAFKKK